MQSNFVWASTVVLAITKSRVEIARLQLFFVKRILSKHGQMGISVFIRSKLVVAGILSEIHAKSRCISIYPYFPLQCVDMHMYLQVCTYEYYPRRHRFGGTNLTDFFVRFVFSPVN